MKEWVIELPIRKDGRTWIASSHEKDQYWVCIKLRRDVISMTYQMRLHVSVPSKVKEITYFDPDVKASSIVDAFKEMVSVYNRAFAPCMGFKLNVIRFATQE